MIWLPFIIYFTGVLVSAFMMHRILFSDGFFVYRIYAKAMGGNDKMLRAVVFVLSLLSWLIVLLLILSRFISFKEKS